MVAAGNGRVVKSEFKLEDCWLQANNEVTTERQSASGKLGKSIHLPSQANLYIPPQPHQRDTAERVFCCTS